MSGTWTLLQSAQFSLSVLWFLKFFYILQIGILWLPMLKSRHIPSSFVMMVSVSSPVFRGRKLCRSRVCASSSIVHLPVPTQFYKLRRLCRGRKKNRWKSCTVAKMVRVSCCWVCYNLIYLIDRMLYLVFYKMYIDMKVESK